jgi:hypothetical protein
MHALSVIHYVLFYNHSLFFNKFVLCRLLGSLELHGVYLLCTSNAVCVGYCKRAFFVNTFQVAWYSGLYSLLLLY